jgi:type IV pilus assembly protein PilV
MRANPPRPREAAGMSMIEVLVAVLLISFALLGLMSLQARAFQFSVDSEDSIRASVLASELAAAMLDANSSALSAGQLAAWQVRVANAQADGLPNGTLEVVSVTANEARITLSWSPPRAPTGVTNRYETDVVIPTPP